MRLGTAIGHAVLAAAMVCIAGTILSPGSALALHNEYPDMADTECVNCHTLSEPLKEPNTSLIRAGARTLPSMKSLSGNQAPGVFGCTFCHANTGRTTYMRDALEHFTGKTSQHPLDRGYSMDDNTHRNITLASPTNTTRWLSNWDRSWIDNSGNQIECTDCHQMDGAYPNHPDQDNALRSSNPRMLKGGNASWDGVSGHATNSFCVSVCHGGTAPGTGAYRMGHYGWGAYSAADGTMREPSGTPLGQTRCVGCHESHYTSSALNLMGELGWSARISASASTNYIDPTSCTSVCHSAAAFTQQGHGKFAGSNQCGSCHSTSLMNSHRNPANPKRLTQAETPPPAGSLADNLASNGLDDDYDGVVDNAGESSVPRSVESVCRTCHQDFMGHGGDVKDAPRHPGWASCLFCHDPHGKGLNNGTDNNIKMVRGTIMGKTARYVAADNNMWRADGTGVCDNLRCHGGKPMGTSALEVGTVMGDVADHRAANVGYTTSCLGCHAHTTASGSFKPDCNGCHEYPGQQFLAGTHPLSPVHRVHAFAANPLNGYDNGYGFNCGACHNSYTHNKLNWTPGMWDNNASVVDVVFDPARNPGATYTAGGTAYSGTCNNLTCHGSRLPAATQGTDTSPTWNQRASGACGTCHRVTAAAPPGTGAHPDHSSSATGYAFACNICHYETTHDGTTIANRSVHADNQSRVSFNAADWRFSATGPTSYGGSLAVGDSASDSGDRCTNLYCHSAAITKTSPFGGIVQTPQWDNTTPLACNGCHENPPSYANPPTGLKANAHPKHSAAPSGFSCQVCHWATTETGTSIPQAKKANHVNGNWDAVSEGSLAANPPATPAQRSHDFAYDNASKTCNTAACHGGWPPANPNAPVWGAAGPIACDVCHRNAAGAPAQADADDFTWDNGVMSRIRDSEWTVSGHGRTSGTYNSGNPAPGIGTTTFPSCTTHCHTSAVSHNTANNPFRLIDKTSPTPVTDFNDITDPRSLKDNKVCLDCHSAAGATPSASSRHIEENHFGLKHNGQDHGGSFCWDCHDPHGDPSDYMVHDNVTRVSDGQYGVPVTRVATSFGKTNLNGESYNAVYDWGDYVRNTTPYSGVCQVCHSTPAGAPGGTTGGAAYFNEATYTATHNKVAGQGQRCTVCHLHTTDFAPSCNSCHGAPDLGSGPPPYGPSTAKSGLNQLWSSSVDNVSNLAGVGNHRSWPGLIDNSSHDPWMATTGSCGQCHTATPGSGNHNTTGRLDAYMDNIVNHGWYNGTAASWENGGTPGATGGVVDDSCSNIDCHSPYYGAAANQYRSGTPMPYRRYWINKSLWDCYTCHAYDGRTGVGSRARPGGTDNTMATGAHGRHVGTAQMACSRCHDVTGYSAATLTGNHKNGFVNWSFAGAPNPAGYPAVPGNAYSVATGSAAPTDDNASAGHRAWGTCANVYCHSIVQTATGGPLTGVAGQYATASWDNATTGQCGSCHNDDLNTPGGTGVPMASGSHAPHLAPGYGMACDACHTGNGTGHATHADGIIEVPMGDLAWRVYTLTAAATVFDRAAAPGVDNANKTPGAAVGRCSTIPCHNDGRAVPGAPRVSPAVWGDTQAASANCTYCHGGNRGTGAAAMATDSHPKHVSGANLACGKCHAGTVAAASDNVITAYDNHVNGVRNVVFPSDVGGTYDNNQRTCTATYCHGTGASPPWGSGPIAGCSVCHQSQGAGTGTASFTGVHAAHVDNTAGHRYRFACEECHSWSATGHPAGSHAGGDDNTSSARTVDVRFTDNAFASWLYNGAAWGYRTVDLWTSPYGAAAPSPAYSDLVATAGTDTTNTRITWSAGRCSNVYCHSNANPADAAGGANTYRTPAWDNATPVTCVACHLGPDTMSNMLYNPPSPDRMSQGHGYHASTDSYAYRCDECHANTVPNDCTTRILDPGGFAYHVDGNKRDIQGSSSVKLSTTVNNAMTYNDNTHICSNVYCHSNGLRQTPPFVARNSGQTAQLAWNLPPTTACGSANPCHASNLGQASTNFATVNDNTAHTKHSYNCFACHITTQQNDSYDYNRLHANGVKDVTISSDANNYDNDTIPNNNYDLPTKTCSGIACHGGKPVPWTDNNLSCSACHTTVNNVDVTANRYDYTFTLGTPNMSKVSPANYANRGHGRNGALPWGSGKNPAALLGRPIECLDCHDNTQFHSTTLFAGNPFRFRTTINGRAVALDNVDTVCYACHNIAAVKDHAKAVTGGGSRGLGHSQKCVDCHDVHGQANIYMIYDNIVWQDNTATVDNATSNGYGVPYYPASRSPVVFTATTTGANFASTDGAAPFDGICEVCHRNTLQYNGGGSLTGPRGHSQDVCTSCHQHPLGFKASCNACHGEATGVGSSGSPPYAPGLGNHPWPSRATVDNLSNLAGVGDHRTATGITASSHETFGCGQCHTSTPGSDPAHDNASKLNASMDNIASHTWTGAGGPLAASWSPGPLSGAPLGGSVVDDSCSNIDCHSPYYGNNSFRSGTPFPYTRYWNNATRWDCYTCHAYDGFAPTNRPGGSDNVIGTGSHPAHLGTLGATPLRFAVTCAGCHVDPGTNLAHKDGLVQVPITGTLGGVTLGGTYSVTPAQPPTDNAAGHRAWGTCNTAYCHSTVQKNNPDGLPNDCVTYVPTPQWGSGSAGVVCGSCHKVGIDAHTSGTDNIATGSHTAHVNVIVNQFTGIGRCNACHQYSGRTGCSGCHASHGGDSSISRHSDGYIDIGFSGTIGTADLSLGRFDNNADGSPDNTIIPGMPYGTCRSLYCHGTGTPALTGGANQAGTPNIPRWGDAATSLCGSCHGGPGGSTNYAGRGSNYPASGAHAIHLDTASMPGPRISACGDCHTSNSVSTHVDGKVDFRARFDNTTATTLAATQTCDPCHGLGAPAAKANWASAGALDCLTCHMNGSLANSRADLTGITAPNAGGDNATYGSYYTGHNRAAGTYFGSGNNAANRACTDCHDLAQRHINHVNDNTYQGNRLTATVPWNASATGGTVNGLCAACHTTTAVPSAGKNRINTHGNTGFSGNNHDPAAQGFAYNCGACHDVHGVTANGRGAGTYNIYMIKANIQVRNFATGVDTTPDNATTTGPVYFESKSGPYSFDDNTSGNANRPCVTCHVNTSRPGNSTPLAVAGSGGSHSGTPGADYTKDERGKDCSGCHAHNQDDDRATVDGLMPLACNDCHSYPGLDNTSPTLKQMSLAHGKHAGTPTNTTTNTKGYACTLCHYNFNHNQSRVTKGAAWPANYYDNVDINFDPSWNPGATTYRGLAIPTVGNGGTGACGGLYCHGDSAARILAPGWGGSDNTPVWNDAATAVCGTCHDTGKADTTTGTVIPSGNHPTHIDNAARAWGPETWRLVGAGNCAEGTGCHTRYGLTPSSTHANNTGELRSTATDNGDVPATLATTQVCRNCHPTYTSVNIPVSGDAQVRTQANWDNPGYLADCIACHNGTAAGTQATANMDGSGGVAHAIEGTIFTMKHGNGLMDLVMCGWCHGDVGHIGARRPVGTDPYRLSGYYFTNYPPVTQQGQIDWVCKACHDMFGPVDHTWRVSGTGTSGPETKAATDTHPTTVVAVGTDKDRWYQVPVSTHMPLFGELLDVNYNRSSGTNNYVLCVTCHDPHGVGTTAVPSAVRRFSGQNTDAKGNKALRFNYSTGTPTALCSQCHK